MKRFILLSCLIIGLSTELHANSDSLIRQKNDVEFDYSSLEMKRLCLIDSIIEFASKHVGTPYKYAGCSPNGFDCSGFMNFVHAHYGIQLVRSSREIARYGDDIKFDDIEPGDLVFFKGRKTSTTTVGHVGLVVEKTATSFKMIHASVSNGVRYDDYTSAYYRTRFLFAKRLSYTPIESPVMDIE